MKDVKKTMISKYVISTNDKRTKKWVRIFYNGEKTDYEISMKGIIRNVDTKHELSYDISKRGYKRVTLYINGKRKRVLLQ